MGADGHVAFYDGDKVIAQFPDLVVDRDSLPRRMFIGPFYAVELQGKLYVLDYWGDNLCDVWNAGLAEGKDRLQGIVAWMETNAKVAEAEVWT